MDKNINATKGYVLAIIAGVCFGLMGVLTRGLSELGFNSLQISSMRPTIAVIVYVLINVIRNPKVFKVDIKGLLFFAIYGIVTFDGMFFAFTYSIEHTSIATASVLLFTNPIIVIILSRIFFKEKLTNRKIIATILTIVGCVLIVKAYDPSSLKLNGVGIVWGIISGFAVALQNILGKYGVEKYDYRTQLVYSFIFAALFMWILSPPTKIIAMATTPKAWILILSIGLFATVIPNGTFIKALQYIESSKVSVLTSVEPIVATLLGYFMFKENVEIPQIIGMIIIVLAVVVIQNDSKNISDKSKIAA